MSDTRDRIITYLCRAGLSAARATDTVNQLTAETRAENERALLELIDDLRDPGPCRYDHHGYCQAHGWMDTEPRCADARAADLLKERGYVPAGTEE